MNNLWHNVSVISDNRFIKVLIVILVAIVCQQILKVVLSGILILQSKSEPSSVKRKYRQKQLKTLNNIARALSIFIVWLVAVLTILNTLKLPIAPLLTSAGLIGAAIAFGMQSLIKDFITGIFIVIDNQYHIDDYIQLNNIVTGRVEAISLRTTAIRDDDGSLHHIPNGNIGITTNLSVGRLKAREQIDLSPDFSTKQFEAKLADIAEKLASDPETARYVKEGPILESIDKITSKAVTVTILFSTSATKRKAAVSAIWALIRKEKIPLA